ncbi:PREDICTED: clustered mitochondria protein homolog isoform X1 [Branchiostoma belcheri]|uniref:Clustered mitochondria protein homolog n=1 Tax=Branchiostoma belcheri TaxID=7741 RepID=A0A6P5AXD4_BRABE|nr:PREDICTED: clustered mitochondria protein homolog isoform X1 [Branchiostoma belcheri]
MEQTDMTGDSVVRNDNSGSPTPVQEEVGDEGGIQKVAKLVGSVKIEGADSQQPVPEPNSAPLIPESQQNGHHVNNHHDQNGKEVAKAAEDGLAAGEGGKVTAEGEKAENSKDDQEVIVIQDMGFNIKVVAPGIEPFELQVSSQEMVQEIHQVLMDREDTCHRTCFSLQFEGNVLDNFAELKNIEGLQEGSVLKVVEEPYTVREARIHMRHVRDLLKSLDPADAYNGMDCSSLSFLNVITEGDIEMKKRKRNDSDSVDCTPPDYVMPGAKDRPILPLQPMSKDLKSPQCLKVLTASGWNPPPGNRKMHGDLMYLSVVTAEDKHFHLTASTRGFFVNQSTQETFNPKPASPKCSAHSLIELLNQISPVFKRNFATLQKRRVNRHPFERIATPFQVYSWTAPQMDHTIDSVRAEDAYTSRLGYEEHIPGQTRDWNEELQTTRELSRKNLPERLLRERAIFKVHSDFVAAATRGAMAVIDGNVMAINPGEEAKMQMFIWNNIFFSLGFDVKDHYKEYGGDYAAYIAPSNDLKGVRAYNGVDIEGLYTLGTVVIDYRGYRVTAQSIIPGILEREQEQSVVYGSIDFGKSVVTNDKYLELLEKTSKPLKILPHKVINDQNEEVQIISSVECKGIVGNDGRYYVLDLLRTFPPDVNFLPMEGEELSEECKVLGFPRKHKHRLACLRQELVDAFAENRYLLFMRHAALQLMSIRQKKATTVEEEQKISKRLVAAAQGLRSPDLPPKDVHDLDKNETTEEDPNNPPPSSTTTESDSQQPSSESKEIETKESRESDGKEAAKNDPKAKVSGCTRGQGASSKDPIDAEAQALVESLAEQDSGSLDAASREVINAACRAIGSLSDSEFDVRFNPDVFSPGVTHPDPQGDQFRKQKQLVKDAAAFLVSHQIGGFVKDCLEHSITAIDGQSLCEALHDRGINMRYLGKVADLLSQHNLLEHIHRISVSEMICRAAKHQFKSYMQGVEMLCLSAAVSHFLNCLLSTFSNPHPQLPEDFGLNMNKKKKNKKRSRHYPIANHVDREWASLTPQDMWSNIKAEVKEYFDFNLTCDSSDSAVETYGLQKTSLLREICIKCGVQVLLREYNFDSKHRATFTEEDIINIFPIVKHVNPKATDAYHFFQSGQVKIQQGFLKEGFELINEALNLFNNVYGAMHPEIAACLRTLARLNYILGDPVEALNNQQKAVLMSERVLGIDHPNTITEYVHLALYCFANQQVSAALRLMYRARYLALVVFGEDHPEMALYDSNIGLILHGVGEIDLSLRFLDNALELNRKYHGQRSLKVALNHHLLARAFSCKGDFRAALMHERETYTIYKSQLGEQHEKTKDSSECLKHLTQQAVVLQRTMNEIYKSGSQATIPPLQISPPSASSVLELINIINGIVFLPLSQKDLDRLQQRQQVLGNLAENKVKDMPTIKEAGDQESSAPKVPEEDDSKATKADTAEADDGAAR